MRLNLSLSSLIIIFTGTLIATFYYTEIYEKIYPIFIISLFFFLLTIFNLRSIFFTKKLLITLILFLSLITFSIFNKDNGVILENFYIKEEIDIRNNIHGSVIIFFTFVIGYLYSLQLKNPLNIFSKIISFQIFFFILYILWYSLDKSNDFSLGIGFVVTLFLPYSLIAFNITQKKTLISLYLLLILFLNIISARGATISLTIFFLIYAIYPILIKKPRLFKFSFFINLFLIFIFIYLYLQYSDSHILNVASQQFFDKPFDTGRPDLWTNLIELINQKIWMGYGSSQESVFINYKSERMINRSLSSHNLYLELLLSGGLFGLILFISVLYSIWAQFVDSKNNLWSRIGTSYLVSALYYAAFSTILIRGNLVYILLFWFFLAVAVAQANKLNRKKIKI